MGSTTDPNFRGFDLPGLPRQRIGSPFRRLGALAVMRRGSVVTALALIATGCSASQGAELTGRLAAAPPLDGYRLEVNVSDVGVFACFPGSGTAIMSVDIGDRRLVVSESGDDRPAIVVDGPSIALRPAAFSSGPEEWWRIDERTPRTSIDRVVGPVVAQLGLNSMGDQPTRSVERLVADADEVDRRGTDEYRIIDRNSDPTIADLTLDEHGHIAQLAVSAEDPRRPGSPDDAQAAYVARYQDRAAEPQSPDAPTVRTADGADLDQLDNRPGACGATVGP